MEIMLDNFFPQNTLVVVYCGMAGVPLGLSCLKFGMSGLLHRQITLHARLINNKLGGDCQKNKKFFNFLVITLI